MKPRWRAPLIATVMTGVLFTGISPASANDNGTCDGGEFCGYSAPNFAESIADWPFNTQNRLNDNAVGDAMRFVGTWTVRVNESNDDFDSAWNRVGVCVRLREHEFHGGRRLDIGNTVQRPSFPPSPGTIDFIPANTASSFQPAC